MLYTFNKNLLQLKWKLSFYGLISDFYLINIR